MLVLYKSLFYVSDFTITGTIYQDEIMYTFGKEHESLQIKRENELYRNTIVVYLRKM
mgnify:FL=1